MTILYNIYISDVTMKFCIFYIQQWKFFRNIWTISYNHNFSIIEKEFLSNLLTIYHSHHSGILIGFPTFFILLDQKNIVSLFLLAPYGGGNYLP